MEDSVPSPKAPWPASFSQPVRQWFASAFPSPTEVQSRAWSTIQSGGNALVIAPTGSGKTLAAFLFAIDRIISQKTCAPSADPWKPGVRILYVSPLKALGADVQRNLEQPLAAIGSLEGGAPVTTAVRSGDSTPDERRRIQRTPPDILITTPESLYLMLTSQASQVLHTVETVIVDEVHSIAGSKRGAHLSLSLERLDNLLGHPAQRIGLSATVRPRNEIARYLGGCHPVTIVADDAPPKLDLSVRVPIPDMAAIPAFGGRGGFAGRGDPVASARYRGKGDPIKALAAKGAATSTPDTRSGSVSIWPYIEAEVLDQILAHRSTIVFVNSRGLCERFTARLNELFAERSGHSPRHSESAGWWSDAGSASEGAPTAYRSSMGSSTEMGQGADAIVAKAHHGSVAKARRQQIERELKRGELPCVVATSSLELGIDMGEVDLVIQIAPPPSVASGLQRIGRANHQVEGRSVGQIYPKVRPELIDAAVMARGMEEGAIEPTALVENALDVLAQQTVAAAAMAPDGLSADEWLATVRKSACFSNLGKRSFESVLEMLAGRYDSGEVAAFSPRILWDRGTGLLTARPHSQRLAVSNAGTIPDRGSYAVVLPEGDGKAGRKRVGELDEEMVHESRVGDIIALGTSTWRIAEIEADRVVVQPAPGRSARLPFWHGDAPARPVETGYARGAFLRQCATALPPADEARGAAGTAAFDQEFDSRLEALGLDRFSRDNLAQLLLAQRSATGALPTDRTLVVEQCQDETGDWRVILHSPFGRKVHEPWALAVSERVRNVWGFDTHAAASDDGILLRVPAAADAVPGFELFRFDPDELDQTVRNLVGSTSLFAARFRECAARALLTSPGSPGKRTPLWQQRLQAGQLLEAARRQQDFPLLAEAMRECLVDDFDMGSLHRIMADLQSDRIVGRTVATQTPSPLAAALIFGYVGEHIYDGDLPHAERKAALLSVDQQLLSELLGGKGATVEDLLDPDAVTQVERDLQHLSDARKLRGAEGAFDLLRWLGPLSEEQLSLRMRDARSDVASALARLQAEHRAFETVLGRERRWVAADDGPLLARAVDLELPPWAARTAPPQPPAARNDEPATDELLARFARTHAVWSIDDAASALGLGPQPVQEAAERLEAATRIVRAGERRWVDSSVLKRLRTASLAVARAAVQPVSARAFVAQLIDRQGLAQAERGPAREGVEGVAWVIAQFEGVYLPMAAWDDVVLPARIARYRPSLLEEHVATGEVLWAADAHGRIAFFPTDSPLAPVPCSGADSETPPTAHGGKPLPEGAERTPAAQVRKALRAEGPMTFSQIADAVAADSGTALPDAAVARALAALVRNGEAASDGLSFPRADKQQLDRAMGSGEASRGSTTARPLPPHPPAGRRASSRRTSLRYREAKASARSVAASKVFARSAFQEAFAGRWALLDEPEASETLQALGLVDSLLDRYGVVSRDIALAGGVPGGLDSLMPVLRQMESAGDIARGMFVEGLGPIQFATKQTVDGLRRVQSNLDETSADGAPETAPSPESLAVLDADDPANLFGTAIAWPDVCETAAGEVPLIDSALAARPTRRDGSLTVVADGAPVLWASPGLKNLLLFTGDQKLLGRAVRALANRQKEAARRPNALGARTKLLVETVNGRPALTSPLAEALQAAGFVRLPDGLRLYADPF